MENQNALSSGTSVVNQERDTTYFGEMGARQLFSGNAYIVKKGKWKDRGESFWIAFNDPMRKGMDKIRIPELEKELLLAQAHWGLGRPEAPGDRGNNLLTLDPQGRLTYAADKTTGVLLPDEPMLRIDQLVVKFASPYVDDMSLNIQVSRNLGIWKKKGPGRELTQLCSSERPGYAWMCLGDIEKRGLLDANAKTYMAKAKDVTDPGIHPVAGPDGKAICDNFNGSVLVHCAPSKCPFAVQGIIGQGERENASKCKLKLESRLYIDGAEHLGPFAFFRGSYNTIQSFTDVAWSLVNDYGVVHGIPLMLEIIDVPDIYRAPTPVARLRRFLPRAQEEAIAMDILQKMSARHDVANRLGIVRPRRRGDLQLISADYSSAEAGETDDSDHVTVSDAQVNANRAITAASIPGATSETSTRPGGGVSLKPRFGPGK